MGEFQPLSLEDILGPRDSDRGQDKEKARRCRRCVCVSLVNTRAVEHEALASSDPLSSR